MAAWVAVGDPAFSKASSRPAAPARKNDRMLDASELTGSEYNK